MGSEGIVKETKELVATQISFGGFDNHITAKDLAEFLEKEVGLVWRCRLKTSSTPPESYPKYDVSDVSEIKKDDYEKVAPHAFVHFASPTAAMRASDAASRCELILKGHTLKVILGIESSKRVNRRKATDPFKISSVRAEIGTLVSRDELLVAWRGPDSGVDFVVDPFSASCKIQFTKDTAFKMKSTNRQSLVKCDFKVEFLVREISEVKVYRERTSLVLLLRVATAPWVSYRTADDNIHESVPFNLLDDEDPWIRTTDFTSTGAIGRCNSYRICVSPRFGGKLERALNYLRERTVIERRPGCQLIARDEPQFTSSMHNTFSCIQYKEGISFNIMFLLNALLHRGIFNQYQLSEDFYGLLRNREEEVNITALRHLYSYKHPVFDAYRRLKLVQEWLLKNPKLIKSNHVSDDNMEVRRLVITPIKVHCLPPEVELSNRVLRRYKEVSDRFLRVTFMDEGLQRLNSSALQHYAAPIVKEITSNSFPQKTSVFERVKDILCKGFFLCDRKYSFLAFSSNQLRDRSAWFFADDKKAGTDVAAIKNWMGKFYNKNVAKCAARMGQCFSSTYATINVPSVQVNKALPDIERNGYTFSDGIGKITPDLAMEVANKLQLTLNPPSAYQIRYAGCKGVIACWPGSENRIQLSLRPSMNKFISNHTILEVVSWSRFQPGFLNRQIVTLLSALEVPDKVFLNMQDTMVSKLNQILDDTDVAFEVLTTSCSEQGNSAALMLSAGFKPRMEPHLRGMLSCIRSAQLGDLLSKSRIFVPFGRWLIGCLDELGVLENGECFIQASTPSLENCFAKHGLGFSGAKKNLKVVTGMVVIAKNPCLHPGDVRVLKAVDVPGLHHLVDCLVFPQKGERPHTDEASGSDLDGDNYFVTWDENLIPPGKKSWPPMDYKPAEVKELKRPVSTQDIVEFFIRTMLNENLGRICNAHVAHADLSDDGALDVKCLRLAELAATAVDSPKTGKIVTMPSDLKPKLYPDFMGKEESQTYRSNKVLGKLYRKVLDISDDALSEEQTCNPEGIPYDVDLEIPGSEDFVADAWSNKCSYDGQLNALLGQYKVSTEEEVVTGHVWSMAMHSGRKQGELKERLKKAYTSLHKEFRRSFEAMGPDFQLLVDDEKNMLYEKKASAWYQVTYHPDWVKKCEDMREPDGDTKVPFRLSFPWIAADYLVRIKVRRRGVKKLDSCKPIDSLASYLADKI